MKGSACPLPSPQESVESSSSLPKHTFSVVPRGNAKASLGPCGYCSLEHLPLKHLKKNQKGKKPYWAERQPLVKQSAWDLSDLYPMGKVQRELCCPGSLVSAAEEPGVTALREPGGFSYSVPPMPLPLPSLSCPGAQ